MNKKISFSICLIRQSVAFDKLSCENFLIYPLFVCPDQDTLLWLSAGWRSPFPEGGDRCFTASAWKKSAAVFCSAQPLPNRAEAVRRSVHVGLLPQLWDGSWGELCNSTLHHPPLPQISLYTFRAKWTGAIVLYSAFSIYIFLQQ